MAKMQNASAAYVPISARPVVMNVVNTTWIIAGGVQKHAIGVQKNAGAWQGQWPKRRNAVAGPVTAFLTKVFILSTWPMLLRAPEYLASCKANATNHFTSSIAVMSD